MNTQETFDTVARHLLTQGEKSTKMEKMGKLNGEDVLQPFCAYRGEGGLKCAIGVLIPDDLYDSDFECRAIYFIQGPVLDAVTPDDIEEYHFGENFLEKLQLVHDEGDPNGDLITQWKRELRAIAESYGLDHSVLNEDYGREGDTLAAELFTLDRELTIDK